MQWKIPAGTTLALAALLIPAAPAMAAQTTTPALTTATVTCQTVILYKDFRTLISIDLDTATDTEVRVQAAQLLSAATASSMGVTAGAVQKQLDGTAEDLRAFLKGSVLNAWRVDLRIAIARTLVNAGANVQAAAQQTLDTAADFDGYLAYLNHGLYVARAADAGVAVVVYQDFRTLIGIDLDTATNTQVRLLANQLLSAAKASSMGVTAGAVQKQLDGTADDLRAFLKGSVLNAWRVDLRIAIARTLVNAGANVQAAAQQTLDTAANADGYLAYLNDGLLIARARDCVI